MCIRDRRAAAAGITYDEQLAIDQKSGREVGGQRGLGQALDANGNRVTAGRQGGAAPAPAQTPAPAATPPAAPAPTAEPGGRQAGATGRAGRGGNAGNAGAQGQGRAGGAAAQAAQDPDDDDNEVVIAGLVGSGGGGLTPLVFAAREGDLESLIH